MHRPPAEKETRPPRPYKKPIATSSAAAAALSSPRGEDVEGGEGKDVSKGKRASFTKKNKKTKSPSSSSVIAEMSTCGVASDKSVDNHIQLQQFQTSNHSESCLASDDDHHHRHGNSGHNEVVGIQVVGGVHHVHNNNGINGSSTNGHSSGLSILSSSSESPLSKLKENNRHGDDDDDDDEISYQTGGSISTISGDIGVKSLQTARSAISSVGTADETIHRRGDGALIRGSSNRQGLNNNNMNSSRHQHHHGSSHARISGMNVQRSARVGINGQEIWKEEDEGMALPEEGIVIPQRDQYVEEKRVCWCCLKKSWYRNRQSEI